MCGIGGISKDRPFNEREAKMCVRLLGSLTRRGTDAWGFFDGERTYKQPGDFKQAEERHYLADWLLETNTNLFLCHTRRTTRGDPQHNPNNHPFWLDYFVMAHNGVIYEADDFDDSKWDIETDSFWLLYWLWYESKRNPSIVDTIDHGVAHVRGVYACWLHDRRVPTTYLFRMGNPIVETAFSREGEVVIFGSDWWSIVDAKGLRYPKGKSIELPDDIFATKPATVYELNRGELKRIGRFAPEPAKRYTFRYARNYGDLMMYHPVGTRLRNITY